MLPGAHFEARRGTAQQARDYTRKEETRLEGPFEYGDFTVTQGSRQDIVGFKRAIDDGATDLELWDNHTMAFLRFARMLPSIRSLKETKRDWKTEVWYLYGPPGCGKTHWIREHAGAGAYWKQPNDHRFNDYRGEEAVVFDEYRKWFPWSTFLQILDKYPLQLDAKFSHVNFVAKRLFISSNRKPKDLYANTEDDPDKYPLDALTRRVDHWVVFLPGIHFSPNDYNNCEIRVFESYAEAKDFIG